MDSNSSGERGSERVHRRTLVPENVSVAGGSFILLRYEAPSNCGLEIVTYDEDQQTAGRHTYRSGRHTYRSSTRFFAHDVH